MNTTRTEVTRQPLQSNQMSNVEQTYDLDNESANRAQDIGFAAVLATMDDEDNLSPTANSSDESDSDNDNDEEAVRVVKEAYDLGTARVSTAPHSIDVVYKGESIPITPLRLIHFSLRQFLSNAKLDMLFQIFRDDREALAKQNVNNVSLQRDISIYRSSSRTLRKVLHAQNPFTIESVHYDIQDTTYAAHRIDGAVFLRSILKRRRYYASLDKETRTDYGAETGQRIFMSPMTANKAQIKQRQAPGVALIPIVVASDKTNVYDDTSAYPVYAWIPSLSSNTKATASLSQPLLIGFVPVSKERNSDKQHSIYTRAFEFIIEPIRNVRSIGITVTCDDGEVRSFMPYLQTFAVDMEEAYRITQVRGPQSSMPCVRCYVDEANLLNLTRPYKERDYRKDRQILIFELDKCSTEAQKAELKMAMSDTGRSMWLDSWPRLDLASSFAFDPLHTRHNGVIRYFLESMMASINTRSRIQELSSALSSVPPWLEKSFALRNHSRP